MSKVGFCPLASGSGGNCLYFTSPDTKILIDAGLSGVRIERALMSIGVTPSSVEHILITHEHGDHISGAGVLARRFGARIYATEATWDRAQSLGKLRPEQKNALEPGADFSISDVTVRPFSISHDAAGPVGYSLFYGDIKVTVATDLGYVCPTVHEHIKNSHILLIESNHDIDMLRNGRYPYHLKQRILGEKGHLSNVTCGQTLVTHAGGLRHVFLGHLSEENNDPVLAYETVRGILEACDIPVNSPCGAGVSLYLADRDRVSKYIRI